MLDVGWICGAAVRAVYWLVMLVCNFLGYSPLWAQIAMKKRKMENGRFKVPSHLAVLYTESRLVKTDEIMELIDSSIVAGIRSLSLYDPHDELKSKVSEFEIICKHMNVDLYSDGSLLYESPRSKMQVHVLSKKMGKAALVEVCKILCQRNEPITSEKVTSTLVEKFKLTDPEFLLQIGNVPSLCGYPPWNLRITEFLQCPRLPSSRRALDYCIESYSQRDIRVGK